LYVRVVTIHNEISTRMRRAFFNDDDAYTLLTSASWCAGTPVVDGNAVLPAYRDSWDGSFTSTDVSSEHARSHLLAQLEYDSKREDFESAVNEIAPNAWRLYALAVEGTEPYAVFAAVTVDESTMNGWVIWSHGPQAVRFVLDPEQTLHPLAVTAVTRMCQRVLSDLSDLRLDTLNDRNDPDVME
jgi:hypothetical protein